MISKGLREFHGRRVLMLQGPVGPFFSRLADDLSLVGAEVFKVNFNGGDWVFARGGSFREVVNYRGTAEAWPAYFEQLLNRWHIDLVLLFGDCRPIHADIAGILRAHDVELGVFEEGYLRPDHITLERSGVNNNSLMPRDPGFFRAYASAKTPPQMPLGSTFGSAARWAMGYYTAATALWPVFRRYRHHRPLHALEGLYWVRSYWRKRRYARNEAGMTERLCGELSQRFFLVPLQVNVDAQVRVHSHYDGIDHFIGEVMTSFAQHARPDQVLVIKHHPMDRGYKDYSKLIRENADKLGISSRCLYIHDQHLPTLLDHARGVVVINSTVGLSALTQSVPVMVCGEAIYDIQGMTFQGTLDDFWGAAHLSPPHHRVLSGFIKYLLDHNQHNGSFYKRLPSVEHQSGVVWMERRDALQPAQAAAANQPRQKLRGGARVRKLRKQAGRH